MCLDYVPFPNKIVHLKSSHQIILITFTGPLDHLSIEQTILTN